MRTQPLVSRNLLRLVIAISFFLACNKRTLQDKSVNLPPASFEISIVDINPTTATLSWTEASDPEGEQVKYSVILDADTVNHTAERTIILNSLEENKKYNVTVVAKDQQGATAKDTVSFTTTGHDSPAPFEVTTIKVGGSIASIQWTPSYLPDSSPVSYNVFLNDQLIGEKLEDTVSRFDFTKLEELTIYTARVVAISHFSKTTESSTVFTTKHDPAPTGVAIDVKHISYSLLKFSFTTAIDDEGQAIKYAVLLNNSDISTQFDTAISPGREYILRALQAETNYQLAVKATDEGDKSNINEVDITTRKQPELVITNKSITKIADGFIYNLETNVDYKPSGIILYVNGTAITSQPATSSIIDGKTISYTYPNSWLPEQGNLSIAANLYWGDETEKSRTATFDSYSYYNFTPTGIEVDEAKIDASSPNKTYTIFFKNSLISADPNYSIVEVVFGETSVPFTIFRTGETTGYLTQFTSSVFNIIDAGPRTGYVIMKDNGGYHKLNFTFSYW